MFNIVDTSFSYGRVLIVCCLSLQQFEGKGKYSACDLQCRYCVFTLWGRNDHLMSSFYYWLLNIKTVLFVCLTLHFLPNVILGSNFDLVTVYNFAFLFFLAWYLWKCNSNKNRKTKTSSDQKNSEFTILLFLIWLH